MRGEKTFVRFETGRPMPFRPGDYARMGLPETLVGLEIDWTMLGGNWVGTTRMPWGEATVTDEYKDRAILRLLAIRIGVRDLTKEDAT